MRPNTLKVLSILLLFMLLPLNTWSQAVSPKREFRGAWIQAVNGQLQGMSSDETKQYLIRMLDNLQRAHVNVILFQVRPEADALYPSKYEPWSRFLSGRQGVAPSPYWDPLDFMIRECHKRSMELHAWINPYRAKTKNTVLSPKHIYYSHPERFVEYEGQLYFNPALQENRNYICKVVTDIVSRYDVDGLHIDDYFYPYPVAGVSFNDDRAFAHDSRGFTNRDDWRRDNVNLFIEQLFHTIRGVKPWVKFGVSPFGIYRNKSTDVNGSATNGLQGYDGLYADVLLWINNGWVDYSIPQLYWEVGHKAADYVPLVDWWARYASARPLVIGQDVKRTVKAADLSNPNIHQQVKKFDLQRANPAVSGSCLWDAASAANNEGNFLRVLETRYHRYPSLMPQFSFIDKKAPKKVKGVKMIDTDDGKVLFWKTKSTKDEMDRQVLFAVYCFNKDEKIDLDDVSHLVAIVPHTYYLLPYKDGSQKFTYVVTALDRLQNESKGVKCKVKL